MKVKDFKWNPNMPVKDLVKKLGNTGFQATEVNKAADLIVKIKKNNARTFLTFTSNMVSSGLRGFFAQLINLDIANVIITTTGSIEEDIMKSIGEEFSIGKFDVDDVELHEQGINRVGNLMIKNESYMNFENWITKNLNLLYKKQKRWSVSSFLKELGLLLNDENSILYQAAKNNIPIFCPAITDGALGFHLYLFQQKHQDFIIDVVQDFGNILLSTNFDEKKAIIALGGSISKHHAILCTLLNGGAEYALYITTAHKTSGSMSGATTSEAKSWGKIKEDSDAVTVIGDVTIIFPLAMVKALEQLSEENLLKIKKETRKDKEISEEDLKKYKKNVKS